MADQQLAERNTDQQSRDLTKVTDRGIQISNLTDLWRFSQYLAKSGLAPKGFDTPERCMIAIQFGLELGLTPMQALQNTMLVNGRPTIWGDAQLAIVEGSGLLEDFWEEIQGEGEKMVAVCYSKRKGRSRGSETTFSVADAKTAGLWGKAGPWKDYPKRMLQMRARSWNLRGNFADVLKGISVAEEVMDLEPRPEPAKEEPADEKPVDAEFRAAPSTGDRLADRLKGKSEPEEAPAPEGMAEEFPEDLPGLFDETQAE